MLNYFDIYEAEYKFNYDIEFLCKLCKNTEILELGCGTGRVVQYLVEKGFDNITGIDICRASIDKAREKIAQDNVNFMVDDAVNFRSNKKFNTILFLFNGVMLITSKEDQKALFENVHFNLANDGKFIFYVLNPDFRRMNENFPYYKYQKTISVSGVDVDKFEYSIYDKESHIMKRVFNYDYVVEGCVKRITSKFDVVFEQYEHYKNLIQDAGFVNVDVYGDFAGESYSKNSNFIVFVAKK